MALHHRKDVCEKYGLASNYLATYINRGQLILRGEYIDDTIPENAKFLAKRQRSLDKKQAENVGPQVPRADRTNKKDPDLSDDEAIEAIRKAGGNVHRLEQLRADKIAEEIDLLRIKKGRQLAELIPVDIIKDLFTQFSKSLATSFHNETDNILTELSHKTGLDKETRAAYRSKMIDVVNRAVDEGVDETKRGLSNLIKEYAHTRGQGEHD